MQITQICQTWVLTRDFLKYTVCSPLCAPILSRAYQLVARVLARFRQRTVVFKSQIEQLHRFSNLFGDFFVLTRSFVAQAKTIVNKVFRAFSCVSTRCLKLHSVLVVLSFQVLLLQMR